MPAVEELIAHNRTTEEVAQVIGADWMIYQDLKDLERAIRKPNSDRIDFDSSVFTGKYVTGDVDSAYLKKIGKKRADSIKNTQESPESAGIDLHNAV